jgi:hypothetical protein
VEKWKDKGSVKLGRKRKEDREKTREESKEKIVK